jgi:oligopeptidase B
MATPPAAPRHPHVRHLHGRDIPDDFAWMAEGGPELTEYLRAELDHYEEATAALDPVRRRLFTEMVARTPLAQEGAPVRKGTADYRDVTPEGMQLGQLQRRAVGDGLWSVVVDLDAEAAAAGSSYGEYGVREVDPTERLLAYSVDTTGEELYELRFRDLATGADLSERIERTYYGGAWSADGGTFFYSVCDHVYRPHQVWRHRIGTDPATDALVLQEDDRRFDLSVRASRDGRWVLLEASSRESAETWAVPASEPDQAPRSVGGRRQGHEYSVEPVSGGPAEFLAVSNHGGAREFTLSWLDLGDTDPARWWPAVSDEDWLAAATALWAGSEIGAQPAALEPSVGVQVDAVRRITGVEGFDGQVVVSLRWAGQPALALVPVQADGLDWSSGRVFVAPPGSSLDLGANEEPGAGFVTVVTQSRVDPPTWWDVPFDVSAERRLRHRAEAPNHDPSAYVVARQWIRARDGEQVPVTLIAHRVTALDGSAPCLLYGYGAYEHVYDPSFSRALPSLLDRGVVYAHVHVRGGGELGRWWWDEGHLATKMNSFTDFVDAARALGSGPEAVVDGARIVSRGGSAGGLLVAASMDLDPEAFAGVIAEVPFVDVVNSMLDPDLPLTVNEWEEWGNPAIAEQYRWLAAYTPYDNVPPAARRPFIFATGAVHDPRVMVHEPAKWVARLRATDPEAGAVTEPGCRGGVLLRVALGEGSHGGAAGRYAALEEEAQTQALILSAMGIGA